MFGRVVGDGGLGFGVLREEQASAGGEQGKEQDEEVSYMSSPLL